MDKMVIKPIKYIKGEISLPGDKSISHRALMLGAISKGETKVRNILESDDSNHTADAFREMGIAIKKKGNLTSIKGKGLRGLAKPKGDIFTGESGTTMRLLCGILAGQRFEATLTGDESLLKRPMERVIEPLRLMGVDIKGKEDGYPPLKIKGSDVRPIDYKMTIASAQVKSAILLAGLYAKGRTRIEERFKSRDHTERMLKLFGAKVSVDGTRISLEGGSELSPKELEIPGDISSASFFITAATILEGSEIRIKNVGINPTRAGILSILSRMGADVTLSNKRELYEPVADILVKSGRTNGVIIEESEIPLVIDELPIIFVLAALSKGRTAIRGISELKVKETDRIRSMTENLSRLGARITLSGNEMMIEGVDSFKGADLDSYGDHRTCMSAVVAALAAKSESQIAGTSCVAKSFPQFFETLERLCVR